MAQKITWVTNATPTGTSVPPVIVDGNYIAAGAARTLADTDHRAIIKLDTVGGSVVTLPTSSGSGKVYRFIVSVLATSPNHVVKVGNTTDVMQGILHLGGAGALPASSSASFAAGATHDTITLNRTTTGGVTIGEHFTIHTIKRMDVAAAGAVGRDASLGDDAMIVNQHGGITFPKPERVCGDLRGMEI